MLTKIKNKYIDTAFFRYVLVLAVPMIIQNAITSFVSFLDNIMVGQVGTEQMSGVAIVNQLIFVFNICIWGGVSGAGIFGTQFYGKGIMKGRSMHSGLKCMPASLSPGSPCFCLDFLIRI